MAQRAIFVLLMLSLGILACNAQFGVTEPTPVAQGPAIVFIAPENNSTIAEGAEITFAVSASNPDTGISKVDFQVDDAPIGSQNAPTPGQPSFSARQKWTAEGIQGHFVTALVYDKENKVIGDAKLTLQVVAKPGDTASQTGIDEADTGDGANTANATVAPSLIPEATTASSGNNAPTLIPTNTPRDQSGQAGTTPSPPVTIIIAPNNQITLRVKAPNLNIRAGDGTNFGIIGALKTGDVAEVVGRNANSTWWVIQKDQTRGWVIASTEFSEVIGDTTKVPLVASPPTPVPSTGPTAQTAPTSTPGAVGVDLAFDSVAMNPATPTVNQTFTVTIVVRNRGTVASGTCLLLGKFQPGDELSPVAVPAIQPGQTVTLTMPVTLKAAGANQTGTLTLDNDKQIDEGAAGEGNNIHTLTYNVNS